MTAPHCAPSSGRTWTARGHQEEGTTRRRALPKGQAPLGNWRMSSLTVAAHGRSQRQGDAYHEALSLNGENSSMGGRKKVFSVWKWNLPGASQCTLQATLTLPVQTEPALDTVTRRTATVQAGSFQASRSFVQLPLQMCRCGRRTLC